MAGTFRSGDMLVVREVSFCDVHPGDVVAFRAPGHDDNATLIVHRVVTRTHDGLITQGDAYTGPDTGRVQASDMVGRVIQAQRGTRPRPVPGGFRGRWWVRFLRLQRRLLAAARAPYRWLRASGIVRRVWRPSVTQVLLMTAQEPVVKYLCGARAVAVWRPDTRTYWCQKPYDLVLDAPVSRGGSKE